jgi:hypothetical protein
MARLAITLSDETHRKLKVQAALYDKTIGAIIEEELDLAREARRQRITAILDEASRNASEFVKDMSDDEIMELAVQETRAMRRERQEERRTGTHHR